MPDVPQEHILGLSAVIGPKRSPPEAARGYANEEIVRAVWAYLAEQGLLRGAQ